MIYHVLRTAGPDQRREIIDAVRGVDRLFAEAEHWGLDPKELDLQRGLRRIAALKKVLSLESA
jgi:hypothetical protein